MKLRSLAFLSLALFGCNSSNTEVAGDGGVSSTRGAVHGIATLNMMTTGDSAIIVSIAGTQNVASTDDTGNYLLGNLSPGSYTLTAQKAGYLTQTAMVMVTAGVVTEAPPINLPLAGTGNVTGSVVLFDQTKHDGTTIALMPGTLTATSDLMGNYTFMNVPAGTYDAVFTHMGYVTQTVHDVVVAGSTFTVGRVVLRRAARVIGGHSLISFGPAPTGESRDLSKVLVGIDNQIFVVPQATGDSILVSGGTNANGAGFSPDGNKLTLTNLPFFSAGTLWIGPSDGSAPPKLVSGNIDGNVPFAIWSPDSSHVTFNTTGHRAPSLVPGDTPPTVFDWYSVPSSGSGATKVVPNGRLYAASSSVKQLLFAANRQLINGRVVEDVMLLDAQAGTATTLIAQASSAALGKVPLVSNVFINLPVAVTTVTSTAGVAKGDLYAFRDGDTTATKLTTATIHSDALIDYVTATGHVLVEALNDTGTRALYAFDTTGAPALRTLIAASPTTDPRIVGDQVSGLGFASGTRQLELTRNGANTDLVQLDLVAATATAVQASVTRFNGGAASRQISGYLRQLDAKNFLLSTGANANTLNLFLWDTSAVHALNAAAVGSACVANLQISLDGKTVAYHGGATTLTSATIPAAGAATTHAVPLGGGVTPGAFNLAEDGSLIAYTVGRNVSLAKSDGSAAATAVTNVIGVPAFTWVELTPSRDQILFGDGAPAINNTFRTAVTAGSTANPIGNLGAGIPARAPLADGKRVFLIGSSADVWTIDLPSGASTLIGTNADLTTLLLNPARTRFMWNGDDAAGSGTIGLRALGTTGSAQATLQPNNPWVPILFSPDGHSTYFLDFNAGALIAYGDTGDAIALATAVDTSTPSSGINALPKDHIMWLDQVSATNTELCATSLNTPGRNLIVKGVTVTTFANPTTTPGGAPWFAPDLSAIYAYGNVNVGTTTAPSFSLASYNLTTSAVTALGTKLQLDSSSTPIGIQYDPGFTQIYWQSSFDSLAGNFTLSAAPFGGAATVVAQNVVAFSFSPFAGGKNLAGTNVVQGVANLFAAKIGAAATQLGAIVSTADDITWTGDESKVIAVDQGNGAAFVGKSSAAGLTEVDVGVISIGMFPDGTGVTAVELAHHPGDPSFFVGRIALP